MRRLASILVLVVLAACSQSSSPEQAANTPSPAPLRSQSVGCNPPAIRSDAEDLADRLTSGNLSKVINSQDLIALPIAFSQVEAGVIEDLEESGPFQGGAECLVAFAESKERLNAALELATGGAVSPIFDDRDIAETWQALLMYYPDSDSALEAKIR
jgi:hypothetical protein